MKKAGKQSKLIALLLAMALILTLFSACGEDSADDGSATASSDPTDSGSIGSEIDQNDVSTASGSAHIDVINVGIETDITDWTPWGTGANSGTAARNEALWGIYQSLIDFDQGTYYPMLFEWYEVADDGMSLTGKLWENIYDSAGNHFTTSDIKFVYDTRYELGQTQFKETIKEIVLVDEYTVRFEFNRALQVGEIKDTFCNAMVTQAAYEASGDGMETMPVGTGPYVLDSQTSGYMFTYKLNENYWASEDQITTATALANVDVINYYVISESSQRAIALVEGSIDICSSISSEDLEKFDNQNGYQIFSYPNNLSMILFPNCAEESICSDLNLRLAICYSISSQAVVDGVYNGNGRAMYSQVPNWATGYNTDWETADTYYQTDVETAKEYLAQSSYNGETLRIVCSSDASSRNTAQIVQSFLKQAGIASTIDALESATFTETIATRTDWDIMLKTQPTSTGFYAQTINSDFAKSRYAWEGTINFIFDDTLQEMITTCMTEATSTQENIDALQQYITDNCYAMGLANYDSFVVVPDYMTSMCLSYKKTIVPGGCTYTEPS